MRDSSNCSNQRDFFLTNILIIGVGMAVGNRPVENSELIERFNLPSDWIVTRTGVVRRYYVDSRQRTSDLATAACQQALSRAGVAVNEIDLLICATMTPEMSCPATAVLTAAKLGARPIAAFDLNAACTGFLAALQSADALMRVGAAQTALVVGADVLSEIIDQDDPRVASLFGDGAAAVVLRRVESNQIGCLAQHLGSDGHSWPLIYHPESERDLPPGHEPPPRWKQLRMEGKQVFRFAVEKLTELIPQAVAEAGLQMAEVRHFVLHQSNLRIIERVCENLAIPRERCPVTIDRYGNTSAASIGIGLCELHERGELRRGDVVVMAAVGGGLTWGVSVWRL
jgi:3-oxoacyl-[acyl-carrier-protein] synthase-3